MKRIMMVTKETQKKFNTVILTVCIISCVALIVLAFINYSGINPQWEESLELFWWFFFTLLFISIVIFLLFHLVLWIYEKNKNRPQMSETESNWNTCIKTIKNLKNKVPLYLIIEESEYPIRTDLRQENVFFHGGAHNNLFTSINEQTAFSLHNNAMLLTLNPLLDIDKLHNNNKDIFNILKRDLKKRFLRDAGFNVIISISAKLLLENSLNTNIINTKKRLELSLQSLRGQLSDFISFKCYIVINDSESIPHFTDFMTNHPFGENFYKQAVGYTTLTDEQNITNVFFNRIFNTFRDLRLHRAYQMFCEENVDIEALKFPKEETIKCLKNKFNILCQDLFRLYPVKGIFLCGKFN